MLVQVFKSVFSVTVFLFLLPVVNAQTPSYLELNKPIERAISGSARENFQLALKPNQFARVEIAQRDADITVKLIGTDNNEIFSIDNQRMKTGSEQIEFVAEAASRFTIEVTRSYPNIKDDGSFRIELIETHPAEESEKLLFSARKDFYVASRFLSLGKAEQALAYAKRALEIRETLLGSNHSDVVASLLSLGEAHSLKGELEVAEKFISRTFEAATPDTLDHAAALELFGRLLFRQGKLTEAHESNEKALAIRIALTGQESLLTSDSVLRSAWIYRNQNNRPKADQLFRSTIAIREKLFGENYPGVAKALSDYGLFLYGGGDYQNALAVLERSLAISEKVLPPKNRQIGIVLNNLGLVEWRNGEPSKARGYYLRALSIFEEADGPLSDGVASISHNLGILFKEDNDLIRAEEFYTKALEILEKLYGENYHGTANALSSLGILYQSSEQYDRAEKFFARALAVNEVIRGPYDYYTTLSLRSLARVYAAKGEIERAIEFQTRIADIEEKIMPVNLSIGSERQKIAYYGRLQTFDRVITLSAVTAPMNELASELAATTIFRRKGRILDALAENTSALRNRFEKEDQKLLDRLSDVNSRLSGLLLSGQQKDSIEAFQGKVRTLENERESIEEEISRVSSGYYQPSKPVTISAIQAALPKNAALVEFAVYRPYNWKTTNDETGYGEPRYIAYVLRESGKLAWKDLGASKPIDTAIKEFRLALRDPQNSDVQKKSRAVDEKVMQPIRHILGDAIHLLVAPDGQLNLIPFEALVDEKNRYLVETFSVTYLTSGRDLLRKRSDLKTTTEPLLISNPLFGVYDSSEVSAESETVSRKEDTKSLSEQDRFLRSYFSPMAGTATETREIQTLYPDARSLTGDRATEFELKKTTAPKILHIATHGFFLADEDKADDSSGPENPLLRSGLALAGANQAKSENDDGILTALEASGLNLWGTKLVVLSACDTGLGEVKNGEGVFGLRRAFTLAGTESLMMSLWAVSDYATRELMINYYKNLKLGMGRSDALRKVQLEMLKKPNRKHPFYWASFIQSGEWANLEGKR